MTEHQGYTTRLQGLLDRWATGDETAIDAIIVHSQDQLKRMAGRMLASSPLVGRWHGEDDVLQEALIRLHRSLKSVKPDSKRAFNGLAATQIRRELIDMARRLYGPEGHARHYKTSAGAADVNGSDNVAVEKIDPATSVADQLEMTDFHATVGEIADEDREVFELIFYQGMTQVEVANLLDVSERTIKRRWREARLSLQRKFGSVDK